MALVRDTLADLPMGALLGRAPGATQWMLATAEEQGSDGAHGWLYALGAGLSGLKHVQLDALTCGQGVQRFVWTMADTNGDGTEEAIGVESDCDGAASSAAVRIEIVNPDLPRAEWSLPLPVARIHELGARDLDRDGAVDLVIARDDGLFVLWRSGESWTESPLVVGSSAVRSFALLDADSAAGKELAFLAAGEVVVLGLDARTPVEVSRLAVGKEAERLRAGDVNGDGVDDLVVSDGHAVRTFFGVSHQTER